VTVVAIHQPNYLPWLGYFAKIARADVLVFLDDVQYSKNSYINRVQIDSRGQPRWLTLPVSFRFGDRINQVRIVDADWRRSHIDSLKTHYAGAVAFRPTLELVEDFFARAPEGDLAKVNQFLIAELAKALALRCEFRRSSELEITSEGARRLVDIVHKIAPGGTYLSGKGGANYQEPQEFSAQGVTLAYLDFVPPAYNQGHDGFLPGLSVVDAVFRLGVKQTSALVERAIAPA